MGLFVWVDVKSTGDFPLGLKLDKRDTSCIANPVFKKCLELVVVILEKVDVDVDKQVLGFGVLLDVHVVLTDVDDQLVREDTVRRRRTFSRNSRWLLPLQCTLQLATVSKPLPIAEGGGRMGAFALPARAYGLGSVSSSCET